MWVDDDYEHFCDLFQRLIDVFKMEKMVSFYSETEEPESESENAEERNITTDCTK